MSASEFVYLSDITGRPHGRCTYMSDMPNNTCPDEQATFMGDWLARAFAEKGASALMYSGLSVSFPDTLHHQETKRLGW